jgi:hypothetical protein
MIRLCYYMTAGAIAIAVSGIVLAQDTPEDKKDEITFSQLSSPATPVDITPQEGNSAFWAGHGVGTQGYVCLSSGSGASRTVNNARPEATFMRKKSFELVISVHGLNRL